MNWFKEHKRAWRTGFILVLALAMIGPWFFDRVNVPRPYLCSPPNVRLEGDFCGVPISITWMLRGMPSQFVYMMNSLISGVPQPYAVSNWIALLISIFLILPFLSTSIMIVWEKMRFSVNFQRVCLGLAAVSSVYIGILGFFISNSSSSWQLWGLWLYIFLTIGLLVVEILAVSKELTYS